MSIFATKRRALILPLNLAFALTLIAVIGCGGKKAIKTTEPPAPQFTAAEPVAQSEPEEKAAPEPFQRAAEPLFLENVYFSFDEYNLTPAAIFLPAMRKR